MTTLDAHQTRIQTAILDVLSFASAVTPPYPLTTTEIMHFLPISALQLPYEQALAHLVADKKVVRIGRFYGLPEIQYPNPHTTRLRQTKLQIKAQRVSRGLGLIPFIRAIVLVGSGGLGNVDGDSNIDLLIVTKPHRMYVAKALAYYTLKLTGQKQSAAHRAGRVSISVFVTTNGINWQREIMAQPEPQLAYWLLSARPLYGSQIWHGMLRQQSWLVERFPNWPWPKTSLKLPSVGWRALDTLDEFGFRYHLRHVAKQPAYRQTGARLRLRPDIINQNPHDRSAEIAAIYHEISSRQRLDS